MNNFTSKPGKITLCLTLLTILFLTRLPQISLAQTVEPLEYNEPALVFAWNEEAGNMAWSEGDQVIILDTTEHTTSILQLPRYPNLVRVILDLGFNPAGTKIFTISLLDEPQIGSDVMEIHIFSLDGKIIAKKVLSNLAEAAWITEDEIKLTIYNDMSWEHGEIKCWNLLTDLVTACETEKSRPTTETN